MTDAHALTSRLADLLRQERFALADFLLALADFDQRRLWADLGHANLFDFLHRALGLSRGAAHYRKTAAVLVQQYPEVLEPIRDGRLCITSLVELAKVLTPENRSEVLPRFFHCSRREAAVVAAEISPTDAAPRRALVTVLPVLSVRAPRAAETPRTLATEDSAGGVGQPAESQAERQGDEGVRATLSAPPGRERVGGGAPDDELLARPRLAAHAHPDGGQDPIQPVELRGRTAAPAATTRPPEAIQPLTADLRRLHVTVSKSFLDKLSAARAALSHARPGASAEQILEAGLDLLLAAAAKKRGKVAKPRSVRRPSSPDHVPAAVKREVWTRDQGRCQWKLWSGGVCGSTVRCELDHRIPKARGGPSTADNLRVLCREHNQHAARLEFGSSWMARFRRRSPPVPPATAAPRPPAS